MGHRALVAYERDDSRYDLHYSHWGAAGLRLRWSLAADRPFGRDEPAARVEPEPIATGVDLATIRREHLDFQLHETFYVVDREWTVRAFLPLWFGLDDACRSVEESPTVGNGALVPVERDAPAGASGEDDRDGADVNPELVRGWFRGTKASLGLLVDRGNLAAADVPELLWERVRERFPRREVVLTTPD